MAINTTIRRAAFNPGRGGHVNLTFNSTTGFTAGTALGIAGDLAIQLVQELPNSQWQCNITVVPTASRRLIIHPGDAVSDTGVPT